MVLPLFHQNKDRSHEKDYIIPNICGECGGFGQSSRWSVQDCIDYAIEIQTTAV